MYKRSWLLSIFVIFGFALKNSSFRNRGPKLREDIGYFYTFRLRECFDDQEIEMAESMRNSCWGKCHWFVIWRLQRRQLFWNYLCHKYFPSTILKLQRAIKRLATKFATLLGSLINLVLFFLYFIANKITNPHFNRNHFRLQAIGYNLGKPGFVCLWLPCILATRNFRELLPFSSQNLVK